ncbi:MAG: hypothetical protein KAJ06_09770, partial [Gammaproteobacteria bacterium]|nr:hypothetical protein [Gammaproteobacteria bacterium]
PMKTLDEAESNLDKNCDGDKTDAEAKKWYLVLGSGPTEIDGTSNRNASVSVIPLERFVDRSAITGSPDPKKDMRIPVAFPLTPAAATAAGLDPAEDSGFGSGDIGDPESFISDMITVDMETKQDYIADVIYFGTISGDWVDGSGTEGWGGKLYRLVTEKDCTTGLSIGEQRIAMPHEWDLKLLIDAGQPITSAPTVGTDGIDFWVYFGTGRFFDSDDKTDDSSNALQTFYGIREPIDYADCDTLTWDEVLNIDPLFIQDPALNDPAQITSLSPFTNDADRGQLGLLPTADIRILSTPLLDQENTLICTGDNGTLVSDGGTPLDPTDDVWDYPATDCLPSTVLSSSTIPYPGGGIRSFRNLVDTVSGTSFRCGIGTQGTDGWYRDFPEDRERNLGQASLLGGLTSYTTYKPYSDPCLSEGIGYLYGVYYLTGTAWVQDVFGIVDVDTKPREENPDRMDLGKGLSTTPNIHVGREEGGKAFIQTSVGKIKEIPQPNLPSKHVKSGRVKWRDIEQ